MDLVHILILGLHGPGVHRKKKYGYCCQLAENLLANENLTRVGLH